MKTFLTSALCALALIGCSKSEAPKPTPATNASSGNPLTAPVDYLGTVAKAKKQMEGSIGNVALSQAIQQFNTAEGRFPTDLKELITKGYLTQMPKPPYQMKFLYDPKTGEVKVVPVQ
ncbi:MAG: hypothetical protein HY301_00125 [Verrucomicrobia bacterium]|nr:hypothetical protein [Verrucomicrobiota bacterium]